MATAWCICKPGAVALIGVEGDYEGDLDVGGIAFNAHRLYGKIQLQHLFANWEQGTDNIESIFAAASISLFCNVLIHLGCLNVIVLNLFLLVYTEAFENYNKHPRKNKNHYQPVFIVRK